MKDVSSKALEKYTQMLKELLLVIEYSNKDAVEYVNKFLILIESKVISKIHNRLDKDSQKELDNLLINIADNKEDKDRFPESFLKAQKLIFSKLKNEEIELLYKEQFIDTFEEWFKQILPTTNDSQRKDIKRILDKYAFGLGL